jgi:hypothetical protein
MLSSGMLHGVALVRTDVSEECSASIIRVTRIDELGTILAGTSNHHIWRRNTTSPFLVDGGATFLQNFGSYKSHMV